MDFPGNALQPGCDFETWERARADELDLQPAVYARVATEEGEEGLALQYWFWYVYNDWNNLHEGDWEMIQLTWDVSTVEEALETDPISVTYSQHGGAERRDWDDERFEREDDSHPVVYVSAGSHAAYFGSSIWIGWARNTGVGCDNTDPPSVPTAVDVIVIPQDIDPNGPFAWLLWDGRWGERQPWEFNGPRGPSGAKWNTPVSWIDDARSYSIAMPHSDTIGPGPVNLFCSVTELGGVFLARLPGVGREVAALIVAILAAPVIIAALSWRYIGRGAALYVHNLPIYLLASVFVFALAALANVVQRSIAETRLGSYLVEWSEEPSFVQWAMGLGLGGFQQLVLGLTVAPAIIQATYLLTEHDRGSWRESRQLAMRRLPDVLLAILVTAGILALLTLTVVLIPLAIFAWRALALCRPGGDHRRRRFPDCAAAERGGRGTPLAASARHRAACHLSHRAGWAAGGMLLVVLTSISLNTAGIVSGVIYSIAYPVAVMAATLFYLGGRSDPDQTPALAASLGTETGDTGVPAPSTA